ncbi:hypothetical protein OXIME_001078 [Oxyplasma meridianum]|uniref:Uncharacterized protein n=1 Tax=Oxyplasma meridianum TaxID=3073602 RepID=A0AAX4NHM3_9ARCH
MERTGRKDRTSVLVSISGLLTVVLGVVLILSRPVYIFKVVNSTFIEYEKDFTIFTIIAGLILIRNGFILKERKKRTWASSITLVIIVTLLL